MCIRDSNYRLFISGGVDGLADDVVVDLVGVTHISGVNLNFGNLTIAS